MSTLSAHLHPHLVEESSLAGGLVVVVDVVRASTTICHALANGALAVIPCADVSAARELAGSFAPGKVLLGGERGGRKIQGFDLGNSPSEYSAQVVRGKLVVFTTSHGTAALQKCDQAGVVLVGALCNLNAVVQEVARLDCPIHLLCAGTDGTASSEDCMCAGAIAAGLLGARLGIEIVGDGVEVALSAYREAWLSRTTLEEAVMASPGGRNLAGSGLLGDLREVLDIDAQTVVPQYDRSTHRIQRRIGTAPSVHRWVPHPIATVGG